MNTNHSTRIKARKDLAEYFARFPTTKIVLLTQGGGNPVKEDEETKELEARMLRLHKRVTEAKKARRLALEQGFRPDANYYTEKIRILTERNTHGDVPVQ